MEDIITASYNKGYDQGVSDTIQALMKIMDKQALNGIVCGVVRGRLGNAWCSESKCGSDVPEQCIVKYVEIMNE